MFKKTSLALAITAGFLLSGCQATSAEQTVKAAPISKVQETTVHQGVQNITLKQAMAHPDWLGRQPEGGFWSITGNEVVYKRKQAGNELRDHYAVSVNGDVNGSLVKLSDLHLLGDEQVIFSPNNERQAYTFNGNIFVSDKFATPKQVTFSSTYKYQVQFFSNNVLAFREGNSFFSLNLETGVQKELVKLELSDEPKGIAEPEGYIATEQHKLIEYVALTHKNKKDRAERAKAVKNENASVFNNTVYLGKDQRIVDAALAPNGKKLLVAIQKQTKARSDSDIMPNYIGQNGEIVAVKARQRVADAKPVETELVLIDVATGKQNKLSYNTLPGFDEDVLAAVKAENYKAQGKTYKSEKSPRAINLMMDWGWSQSAIQWNHDGSQLAVMLEAWDNKDRWIATVDLSKNELTSQHRLHDDAWVNYTYNDFGWVKNSNTLYYLSEQDGYSHIYSKSLNNNAKQLTNGQFVVSELTQSSDGQYLYYKANKKHPGIYEIYRVNLATGTSEALTDLNGMTDYKLSPKGDKLLLTHSKLALPPELYVKDVVGADVKRLTNTVSTAFLNTQLVAPKVVAVPSSHGEQPIYAKVYYPADYVEGESLEKRRAVIFNHGAGYLQNSHLGWSGYFREFMFHSFLAQQGYVVMDMDYRASKGYGRDWRTAIYRQMGTPEIQDLEDGVNWMVNNANVDSKRVGTYGGSYGGFMTFMALLTKPDLFQAGAALRPVTDWAYYNAPYTSNILNHPDVDPIAYKRSSPIYFAEGLKNKLLINAPMIDDNVFFQDVVRLVQRFIELEKENFETAIYPVEPHGFKQPSSWLDEYRRIYKLFEETL